MLVEFTLQPEGDNTRLRVVETGHVVMDWPDDQKARYAADHGHGWEIHSQGGEMSIESMIDSTPMTGGISQ